MRIIDCEQYSADWWEARRGLPTASGADRIITVSGKPSASADAYIAELIDEIVRPMEKRSDEEQKAQFHGNRHTERGHTMEPKAVGWFQFVTGLDVRSVGLILRDDGLAACSPDALVAGDSEGLEIKAPEGKKHALWMLGESLPDEHKQQVHFSLAVTGLSAWHFLSYCPGYKPFRVRVEADAYTAKVKAALEDFTARLAEAKQTFIDYMPASAEHTNQQRKAA